MEKNNKAAGNNLSKRYRNADIQQWALRLYDTGLVAFPCWGGGKALPRTRYKDLADNPPSRNSVGTADYSGGLSILLGTHHPAGGFLVGLDIDEGPDQWMFLSNQLVLLEEGTAPGKWHAFLTTQDRLLGQINLRDDNSNLVAEIKGYGLALRSWPTKPEGKPRGYKVFALTEPTRHIATTLTVSVLAEELSTFLSRILGKQIRFENQHHVFGSFHRFIPVHSGLREKIEAELESRGVILRPSGKDGWQSGCCPFHEDRRPSFSISFELGVWKCWAGCGSGGLRSLAQRLGIRIFCHTAHIAHPITTWEVKG